MRQFGWQRATLAAVIFLTAGTAIARAQPTTREAASVLIFPKVIADGTYDTAIQISNTANRTARAVCYYVNGAPVVPDQPPGPLNPPQWSQIDFTLFLVRQQPTQWVVSRGRLPDSADERCEGPLDDCDGTGLDPGRIPPAPSGFTGELVCIETDASGAEWSGNALTGHATLTHLGSGEIIKLPAIGAHGFPTNDADGTLCLGGEPQDGCPKGGEYDACATEWFVSHPADFDDTPVDGEKSSTSVTIVPCGQDFDAQIPTQLTVQFRATNEFEQSFSASTTVNCWADFELSDAGPIFNRDLLSGDWALTRIVAASATQAGFTVVSQTLRVSGELLLVAAAGSAPPQGRVAQQADLIRIPVENVP
jgi:hypothetical protein